MPSLFFKVSLFFLTAGIIFFTGCYSIPLSKRYSENVRDKDSSNTRFHTTFKDSSSFNQKLFDRSLADTSSENFRQAFINEKILAEVVKFINTPYVYGGNSRQGTDCSGFTMQVFKNSINLNLYRTANDQFNQGKETDTLHLKFGDLLFFDTQDQVKPGHVAIYLWGDEFVHTIPNRGVNIDNFRNSYYKKRFLGAKRVLN